MQITINSALLSTLQRLADSNSTTVELYAQNVLESHLRSMYKETIVGKITSESVENLPAINSAIDKAKASIAQAPIVAIDPIV